MLLPLCLGKWQAQVPLLAGRQQIMRVSLGVSCQGYICEVFEERLHFGGKLSCAPELTVPSR